MQKVFIALSLILTSCVPSPSFTNQKSPEKPGVSPSIQIEAQDTLYKNTTYGFTVNVPPHLTWTEKTTATGATLVSFSSVSKNSQYSLIIEKDTRTLEEKIIDHTTGSTVIDGFIATQYTSTVNNQYPETVQLHYGKYLVSFASSTPTDTAFKELYRSFKGSTQRTLAFSTCDTGLSFEDHSWFPTLTQVLSKELALSEKEFERMLKNNPSMTREEIMERYGYITPDRINTLCTSPDESKVFIIAGAEYMQRGKLFLYTLRNKTLLPISDPNPESGESWYNIYHVSDSSIELTSGFADGPGGNDTFYSLSLKDNTLTPIGTCSHKVRFSQNAEAEDEGTEYKCTVEGKSFVYIRH